MTKYKWETNHKINQLLVELEAVNLVFSGLKSVPEIEANLRSTALLKSAVFSARIEGFNDTEISPKLESQNLLKAYKWIRSLKAPKKVSINFLRNLHKGLNIWNNDFSDFKKSIDHPTRREKVHFNGEFWIL